MKKIFLNIIVASTVVFSASCSKSFLEHDPSGSVDSDKAFESIKDIDNAVNGAYNALGTHRFLGRNVIATGDMAADNAIADASSGHFVSVHKYFLDEQNPDMEAIWAYGYKVVDRTARLIQGADKLMGTSSDADKKILQGLQAQAYGLRALANFTLVNVFGFAYAPDTKDGLGLVLVENGINIGDDVARKSVGETYSFMESDIAMALSLFDKSDASLTGLYMNRTAVLALKARVQMFKGDYSGVVSTTSEIMGGSYSLVNNSDTYYDMWGSTSLSSEDIFVIAKSSQDNLSANSLNTLYGSYRGTMSSSLTALFGNNDYRLRVLNFSADLGQPAKFRGTPEAAAVSNIPVFRLSEVYLLSAEAKAHLGDASGIDDLFEIAKRNVDLKKSDIPSSGQALLDFISQERRRELYQEGHRWYDMRRTGEIMKRSDLDNGNFDVKKFVYPVPLYEINASGIKQNDWLPGMPNQN